MPLTLALAMFKKKRPPPLYIPKDVPPSEVEPGVCLVCYEWVGVNGVHSPSVHCPTSPGKGTTPHSPLLASLDTPHIIISSEDPDPQTSTDTSDFAAEVTEEQETEDSADLQKEPNAVTAEATNAPVEVVSSSTAPPSSPTFVSEFDGQEKENSVQMRMNMRGDAVYQSNCNLAGVDIYRKTRRNSVIDMMQRFGSSQTNLQVPQSSNLRRSNSRTSIMSFQEYHGEGNDALITILSALYAKLLVVIGMAFPMAKVISNEVPIAFYMAYYLYLYIGSIAFLIYSYLFLLRTKSLPTLNVKSKLQTFSRSHSKDGKLPKSVDEEKDDRISMNTAASKTPKYTIAESSNHVSMYLKMGAVLFGFGSMIYSGLEVGKYFDLKDNCKSPLNVITPSIRMLFIFIQMYFIFLNSRVAISKHRVIARFGLMHMIGTNLCIWFNVLIQETEHEIALLTPPAAFIKHGPAPLLPHNNLHPEHDEHIVSVIHAAEGINGSLLNANATHAITNATAVPSGFNLSNSEHVDATTHAVPMLHMDSTAFAHSPQFPDHELHGLHKVANESHNIVRRGTSHHSIVRRGTTHHNIVRRGVLHAAKECEKSNLMGEVVDNASPFLFPCTIEYSLLCSCVLYIMWKNINKSDSPVQDADSDISTYVARKTRHHYSVDCAHASKGLFMGILILALTVISLILFFVLINNVDFKEVAILEANIIELTVYSVAILSVIVAMIQMRELEFIPEGDIELDNSLLLIAQTGVYIYTSFTIIGGHFSSQENLLLPLLTAIITLTQTTLQTIFILDASKRCCYTQSQLDRKPGREMVTFLLICNLAMWAINTFETSRADAHPTQLHFYGIWAWTIISHISMPLAIFYRFHVTVCLCEIWKKAYKLKHDFL